jgi:hypothetical protein
MQLGNTNAPQMGVEQTGARHQAQLWIRDVLPEVSRYAQRPSLLAGQQRGRTRNIQMQPLRECQRMSFRHHSWSVADLVITHRQHRITATQQAPMSIQIAKEIHCDGCSEWLRMDYDLVRDAWPMMRREGWTREKRETLVPPVRQAWHIREPSHRTREKVNRR